MVELFRALCRNRSPFVDTGFREWPVARGFQGGPVERCRNNLSRILRDPYDTEGIRTHGLSRIPSLFRRHIPCACADHIMRMEPACGAERESWHSAGVFDIHMFLLFRWRRMDQEHTCCK